MIKRSTKLLLLLCAWVFMDISVSQAQKTKVKQTIIPTENKAIHPCRSDEINRKLLEENPELQIIQDEFNELARKAQENARRFAGNARTADVEYTIPVVFHSFHPSDPYSALPLEQAQDVIDMLNEDFNAENSDFSEIDPYFKPLAADIGIRFVLARFDPNGQATSGVTYTVTSDAAKNDGGGFDTPFKEKKYWPRENYMNVWVVGSIDGSEYASGYAYLPPRVTSSPTKDGIVYNRRYLGRDGIGSSDVGVGGFNVHMARVMTHEVGHYLGLSHTHGDGGCSYSDGIDDTPATIEVYDCDTTYAPCGEKANVENYMGYHSCTRMYTTGQKAVMRAAMESSISGRSTLTSAENLKSTLGLSPENTILVYNNYTFSESLNNGGGVDNEITVELTGGTSDFISNPNNLVEGTHFRASNVPAGLVMEVSVVDNKTAQISLSGNAKSHLATNSLNNLGIEFLASAFTGDFSKVVLTSNQVIRLAFENPYRIVHVDVAPDRISHEGDERVNISTEFGNLLFRPYYRSYSKDSALYVQANSMAFVGQTDLTLDHVEALTEGTVIDSNSNWDRKLGETRSFPLIWKDKVYHDWEGQDAYMGIEITKGKRQHYGWIHLRVSPTGDSLTVFDYAYNERPFEAIKAGQTDNPILTYSQNTLWESFDNDGSIRTEAFIDLATLEDEFSLASGNLVKDTHYTISGLPSGLNSNLEVVDSRRLKLSLSGNTTRHNEADSVSNVRIEFNNAAFASNDASSIVNRVKADLKIKYYSPFEIISFNYTSGNVIDSGNAWERFTMDKDGDLFGNGEYGFENEFGLDFNLFAYIGSSISAIPEGGIDKVTLFEAGQDIGSNTPWIRGSDARADEMIIKNDKYLDWKGKTGFIGVRIDKEGLFHYGWFKVSINSAGNSLKLHGYAFNTEPLATIVAGNTGAASLTASSTIFKESEANDGSINPDSKIKAILLNDEFAPAVGSDLTKNVDYSISNLPAGLEVSATVKTSTVVEFTLTGNAVNHEQSNEVNNISITFNNSAFESNWAGGISGTTINGISTVYFNPWEVVYTPSAEGGKVYVNRTTDVQMQNLNLYEAIARMDDSGSLLYATTDSLRFITYEKPLVVKADGKTIVKLNKGDLIDDNLNFQNGKPRGQRNPFEASEWAGNTGFLATKIIKDGKTHFAWYEFEVSPDTNIMTFLGWAYHNKPNTPLRAGEGKSLLQFSKNRGYYELDSDVGAVDNSNPLIITSEGQEWDKAVGATLSASDFNITNVPSGLSPVITVSSATEANLTFTGNASDHRTSIEQNVKLSFTASAFKNVSDISKLRKNEVTLIVAFADANTFGITYVDNEDLVSDANTTRQFLTLIPNDANTEVEFAFNASKNILRFVDNDYVELVLDSAYTYEADYSYGFSYDFGNQISLNSSFGKTLHRAYLYEKGYFETWEDKTNYLGIKILDGSTPYFGWIRVEANADGTQFIVKDYAYNKAPYFPINAGQREPGISYGVKKLEETLANNGKVNPKGISINLFFEQFTQNTGVLDASKYSIENVPAGLNPKIVVIDSISARLVFEGQATSHGFEDAVSNISLEFYDAAIKSANASKLINNRVEDISIKFFDEFKIVYEDRRAENITNGVEFDMNDPIWSDTKYYWEYRIYVSTDAAGLYLSNSKNVNYIGVSGEKGTALVENYLVDGSRNYQTGTRTYFSSEDQFVDGESRYIGVRINKNGLVYYGWLQVETSNFVNGIPTTVTLLDHAYNAQPNTPIKTGQKTYFGEAELAINDGQVYLNHNDKVNLGTIALDESPISKTFSLENIGNADLDLVLNNAKYYEITGTDASDFSMVDTNLKETFIPGESANFDIVFTPSSKGVKQAVLNITSNDEGVPVFKLRLNAEATPSIIIINPVADFSSNPSAVAGEINIIAGESVSFTDASTNFPDSWSWKVADLQEGTNADFTHTFANAGTFTVELTAENTAGSSSKSVTVNVSGLLTASITPDSSLDNLKVLESRIFTANSNIVGSTYSWEVLKDGNVSPVHTGTGETLSYQFATAGNYEVKLTTSNASQTASASETFSVTKLENPATLKAIPELLVNATHQLEFENLPAGVTVFYYAEPLPKPNVYATVSTQGLFSALKATQNPTANQIAVKLESNEVYNQKILYANFSIKLKPQTLTLSTETINLKVGESFDISTIVSGNETALVLDNKPAFLSLDNLQITADSKGSGTITVRAIADDVYASSEKTITVNVSKQDPVVTFPSLSPITYGTALDKNLLSAGDKNGILGTFEIDASQDGSVLDAGTPSVKVWFKPTATDTYNEVFEIVNITVSEAVYTLETNPSATAIEVGQQVGVSTLSGGSVKDVNDALVSGSFVFVNPSEVATAQEPKTVFVKFVPATANANYLELRSTVTITVNPKTKVNPVVTFPSLSPITYGTALDKNLLSAGDKNGILGTFEIDASQDGSVLDAGTPSVKVWFKPTATDTYNEVFEIVNITVSEAVYTLGTNPSATAIEVGQQVGVSTLSGGSVKDVNDALVSGSFVFVNPSEVATAQGPKMVSVKFVATTANANYLEFTSTVTITVNPKTKVNPVVTFPSLSPITYGTALDKNLLSAGDKNGILGTFEIDASQDGSILDAGTPSVKVWFKPTATDTYNEVFENVNITVSEAVYTLEANPSPTAIEVGQQVGVSALSGGSVKDVNDVLVSGSFVFVNPSEVATAQEPKTVFVKFVPATANANYLELRSTVTITVNPKTKVNPVVTFPSLSPITYGTALDKNLLSAGDKNGILGTFEIDASQDGSVLDAGTPSVKVWFKPTATDTYNEVFEIVNITVSEAVYTLGTNPSATAIEVGQQVGVSTLSGGSVKDVNDALVSGSFVFVNPSEVATAQGPKTVFVKFVATTANANYLELRSTVAITVNPKTKVNPVVTFPSLSPITYGTALDKNLLSAGDKNGILGTFEIDASQDGSILDAGTPSVKVWFKPTATDTYNEVFENVNITVSEAVYTLETNPSATAIEVGQQVGVSTLSGESVKDVNGAVVSGSFVFVNPSEVATAQGPKMVFVKFVPTLADGNYSELRSTVTITVNPKTKVDPVVTFPSLKAITYGAVLENNLLKDGNDNGIAGSFEIDASQDGSILDAGTPSVKVWFKPTATDTYNEVFEIVNITVSEAVYTLGTNPSATAIEVGQQVGVSTLSGGSVKDVNDALVSGSFVFVNPSEVATAQGPKMVSVKFVATTANANYLEFTSTVTITVNPKTKVNPVVTFPSLSPITYGTALDKNLLSAGDKNGILGTFEIDASQDGSILDAGTPSVKVWFKPTATDTYNEVFEIVNITVSEAVYTLETSPSATAIEVGQQVGVSALSGGSVKDVNDALVSGSFVFVNSSEVATAQGPKTVSVKFVATTANANYLELRSTVAITVNTPAKQNQTLVITPVSGLEVGGTETLTVSGDMTSLTYTSSDENVATVSTSGVITAIAEGTVTITVNAEQTSEYNAGSANVSIRVNKTTPVVKFTLKKVETTDFKLGETYTFEAATYSEGAIISWSVSRDGVDLNLGSKRGRTFTHAFYSEGTYVVYAKASLSTDVQHAKSPALTVNLVDQSLSIATVPNLKVAQTAQLQVSGNETTLVYVSSNESVLTVSETGLVSAKGAGTATITVIAKANDKYKTATKTIDISVDSVELKEQNITVVQVPNLEISEMASLNVTGAMTTLTYTSSDESVATVDENGLVTAIAEGDVTITVNAEANIEYEAASATVSISVLAKDSPVLGKNDRLENLVSVYPNPTNGIFYLNLPAGSKTGTVEILTAIGSSLGVFDANQKSFDISDQVTGIYYLKVTVDSETVVLKLFVK